MIFTRDHICQPLLVSLGLNNSCALGEKWEICGGEFSFGLLAQVKLKHIRTGGGETWHNTNPAEPKTHHCGVHLHPSAPEAQLGQNSIFSIKMKIPYSQ